MLRHLFAGAIVSLCLHPAFAEEGNGTAPATSAAATADPKPIAVGDRWTYQVKDEISGEVKRNATAIVTDISQKEIATRVEDTKGGKSGVVIYDPSWNVINTGTWRNSPNDGSGVQLPLAAGKTWKISYQSTNASNGAVWKRSGSSRVTGQESITTKAGKFDVFVIETNLTGQNTRNPTQKAELSARVWYSPEIDHWVKRNVVIRQNGHVFQNNTSELTEFVRKK